MKMVLTLILIAVTTFSFSRCVKDSEGANVPEDVPLSEKEEPAREIDPEHLQAGDTLVLKNGIYTDVTWVYKAEGTAEKPVVIRAEEAGKVILTGHSSIQIAGRYVEVWGLFFKDGALTKSGAVVSFKSGSQQAEHCLLADCRIESYNPATYALDYKWVSLYGRHNRVEHCSFVNKTNSGTLLVVWLDGQPNEHVIRGNYFGKRVSQLDETGKQINGQEIIRIGDSHTSMSYSNTLVEGNYFQECNGEVEIISNKSCGNVYRNNVFYECGGTLTLRHGNDCTVDGNYFFGNNQPNTGGIRVIGEKHKVYNNYLEKLQGSGYRAALSTVMGEENSALNGYFQVKEASIVCNTVVDCKSGIEINNASRGQTMPVMASVLALNAIRCSKTTFSVYKTNGEGELDRKDNVYDQGKFTPPAATLGFRMIDDLKLEKNGAIYEPTAESGVLSVQSRNYDWIQVDILGRSRDGKCCAGASQPGGIPTRTMPTVKNTGVSWK